MLHHTCGISFLNHFANLILNSLLHLLTTLLSAHLRPPFSSTPLSITNTLFRSKLTSSPAMAETARSMILFQLMSSVIRQIMHNIPFMDNHMGTSGAIQAFHLKVLMQRNSVAEFHRENARFTSKQEAPLTLRGQRGRCRNIKGEPQRLGSFPSPRPRPLFLCVWFYGGRWQTQVVYQI